MAKNFSEILSLFFLRFRKFDIPLQCINILIHPNNKVKR